MMVSLALLVVLPVTLGDLVAHQEGKEEDGTVKPPLNKGFNQ